MWETYKERLETQIAVHKEMAIVEGDAWTKEYKEGYIDGLIRAIELLNLKN